MWTNYNISLKKYYMYNVYPAVFIFLFRALLHCAVTNYVNVLIIYSHFRRTIKDLEKQSFKKTK